MYRRIFVLSLGSCLATSVLAQFTGPESRAPTGTVAVVRSARLGSYITLTGNIVDHQRGNYYTFRDSSGTIRVEIEPDVWGGQKIGPETKVRLVGEVGTNFAGRYVWVKSIEVA